MYVVVVTTCVTRGETGGGWGWVGGRGGGGGVGGEVLQIENTSRLFSIPMQYGNQHGKQSARLPNMHAQKLIQHLQKQ